MQKQFTKNHTNMAKGLFILLVLTNHLFRDEQTIVLMDVIYTPFSLDGFLFFSSFCTISVSVFVFLTSFGIATGLFALMETLPEDTFFKIAYRQATRRFSLLMLNFTVLYLSVNLLWWRHFDYQSLYGAGKQGFLFFLTDALGLFKFFDTPTLNETWWYMEIAYLLIFLVPFLTWLVRKIGYPILLLAGFFPFVVTFHPDLKRYLFVAVFGVCAAYGKWPDKLLNLKFHPVLQWLAGGIGFLLCVLIRQNYVVHEYYIHLVDAPVALFLIYVVAALIGSVPGLGKALAFVGRHSMNIYLVHTFFYLILWRQYIYHFRYAGVTFLLLLGSCLLYSVLLEWVKKIIKILKSGTKKASG